MRRKGQSEERIDAGGDGRDRRRELPHCERTDDGILMLYQEMTSSLKQAYHTVIIFFQKSWLKETNR
jgi:hypothetical protein